MAPEGFRQRPVPKSAKARIEPFNDELNMGVGVFRATPTTLTFLQSVSEMGVPAWLAPFRDSVVLADAIPNPNDLILKMQGTISLTEQGQEPRVLVAKRGSEEWEQRRLERRAAAHCDECGDGAGHLTENCLIRNDKEIPWYISPQRKAFIEQRRKERVAKAQANLCVVAEVEEAFISTFKPVNM